MMNLKKHHPIRDFMLLVLLVLLIKPALYLSEKRIQAEKCSNQENFLVHELDQGIMSAFTRTKDQINKTIALAQKNKQSNLLQELNDLAKEIQTVETRYTKNSPALLFLGPFASISIVLKEQKLEKKLKTITNRLNQTLHKVCIKTPLQKNMPENTIIANLRINQALLASSQRLTV
ncbi:hypothetical protein KAH94_01115 [bacterium]|nr:hypothetical protein [bacterium]